MQKGMDMDSYIIKWFIGIVGLGAYLRFRLPIYTFLLYAYYAYKLDFLLSWQVVDHWEVQVRLKVQGSGVGFGVWPSFVRGCGLWGFRLGFKVKGSG